MAERVAEAHGCTWCGVGLLDSEERFCCSGCATAAALVEGAGLGEQYFAARLQPAPRPEGRARGWAAVPVAVGKDGRASITLAVDGLRCASCTWLVEHVLERTEGVVGCRVSYASGRATVAWVPALTDLDRIAARIAALGYAPRLTQDPRNDRDLLLRLGVAAFLALNVMGLHAAVYAGWFQGMDVRFEALFAWMSLVLATPAALWCAAPFHRAAWAGLTAPGPLRLADRLHLDLPISLGVLVAWVHGVLATVAPGWRTDTWLDSMTMLVALLLAGRALEGRGRRQAAEAAAALAGLAPVLARRMDPEGGVHEVAPERLQRGDRLVVAAGEEVAADGVVLEGSAEVRMDLLTGESRPVHRGPADAVVAGAVLLDGNLVVEVGAVGEETLVQRLAAGLGASLDRAEVPGLADRLAPAFTAATLLVAASGGVAWSASAGLAEGLRVTLAVLVVACPCALALAGPTALAAALGACARRGLLLRSGEALLRLGEVDVAALDKTGTLTHGRLAVTGSDEALGLAAALERHSAHPVARAIVREATDRGLPLARATLVRELPGQGIVGQVGGDRVWVERAGAGRVTVDRVRGGVRETVGLLELADTVRPDARGAVAAFVAQGVRVTLLTGDHADVAAAVGRAAGLDHALAGLSPEDKVAEVQRLQASGRRVLFCGDGWNDAPALAAAHVGVAMQGGAAASVLVADGVVQSSRLGPLVVGRQAAVLARATVRSSLALSLVYNVVTVGLALAGLVNPLVAAVLMPVSSAAVVARSRRLGRAIDRLPLPRDAERP